MHTYRQCRPALLTHSVDAIERRHSERGCCVGWLVGTPHLGCGLHWLCGCRPFQNGCKAMDAETQVQLADNLFNSIQRKFVPSPCRSLPCPVLFLGPWTGPSSTGEFVQAATATTAALEQRNKVAGWHFLPMLQPVSRKKAATNSRHIHYMVPQADPVRVRAGLGVLAGCGACVVAMC